MAYHRTVEPHFEPLTLVIGAALLLLVGAFLRRGARAGSQGRGLTLPLDGLPTGGDGLGLAPRRRVGLQ